MQNLSPIKTLFCDVEVLGSGGAVALDVVCIGFLTDQTARAIETTIANMMIMNKSGLSETKLNDNGITG